MPYAVKRSEGDKRYLPACLVVILVSQSVDQMVSQVVLTWQFLCLTCTQKNNTDTIFYHNILPCRTFHPFTG